jgi:type IV pilus assembly protein PilQ
MKKLEVRSQKFKSQESEVRSNRLVTRYSLLVAILLFTAYYLLSTISYSYASNYQITNIEIMDNAVKIEADGPIKYKISKPADPFRVVVEMEGIGAGRFTEKISSYKAGIVEVIPSQTESPSLSTRLDILLHAPMAMRSDLSGNTLVLYVEQPQPPAGNIFVADRETASEVIAVLFYTVGEGAELVIKGDGIMPEPAVFEIDGRMFIDMSNLKMKTTLPDNIKAPLKDIVYREEKDRLRMILDIGDMTDADVFVLNEEIVVSLSPKDMKAVAKIKDEGIKNDIRQLDAANAGIVSLDFQDADIVAIIRLLSEVGGYNVVIHPDVQGKISMRLLNVSWHHALDIILSTFNLKKTVEDNVIRIVTIEAFRKEKEALAKIREVFGKAEDIGTKIFVVNYADVEEVKKSVENAKILSPRGSIGIDKRTRSLIVNDTLSGLTRVEQLIASLDKPTQQVLIEARIVEVSTDFARDLGVQWGFRWGEAGNTLAIGSAMPPPPGGRSPGIINLPVQVSPTFPGGAMGAITMGYLNARQTFGLDLRLSAAEAVGKARLVSSPKIMTIENEKAEIIHGTEIPVVTPGAEDRPPTVTYRLAALHLIVTPSVMPDETVSMVINIKNDVPDFARPVAGNIPIHRREAKNEVLVRNGETVVIGGILKTSEDEGEDRVPGLHRLPLLGWLFKRELKTTETQELLIFITPRIVQR